MRRPIHFSLLSVDVVVAAGAAVFILVCKIRNKEDVDRQVDCECCFPHSHHSVIEHMIFVCVPLGWCVRIVSV